MRIASIHEKIPFYFGWNLADLVCISSGLGFNGYDSSDGQPKWDLLNNFNILHIEAWIFLLSVWISSVAIYLNLYFLF
jgi:hypothetical protein